jgi:hypothetical protein
LDAQGTPLRCTIGTKELNMDKYGAKVQLIVEAALNNALNNITEFNFD